jgi:asparagine synthase (glutamine-hydrolysing)
MLLSMRHRAHDGYGLASERWAKYSTNNPPLVPRSSGPIVGCCRSKILPHDTIQPLLAEDATLALDGRLYGARKLPLRPEWADFARLGERSRLRMAGAYACVKIQDHDPSLLAFTDPIGLKPLYWAKTNSGIAVASEIKAFSKLTGSVNKLLPTQALAVDHEGRSMLHHHVRPPHRQLTFDFETCAVRLHAILRESAQQLFADVDEVTVSFSGGLDSVVTAALASNAGVRVTLVGVGLRDQPDELAHAEKVAEEIGCPFEANVYDRDQVEAYVRRIEWLIEDPSLMKVAVAIPVHWAAESAARHGPCVLVTGQGSDELFGGYWKFATILDRKGWKGLRTELVRAVVDSHLVNFARDEKAVGPFRVELRSVFTMPKVVDYGLRIPPEFKVHPSDDVLRKWILRRVGELIGLPTSVTGRRKRAIQHGTGVEEAIRSLSKRAGKKPTSYLTDVYRDVKELDTMP